jgi:hypothetical protein
VRNTLERGRKVSSHRYFKGTKLEVRPIEAYLILKALIFGIILLTPFQTFSNLAYEPMEQLASEWVWGLACILLAVFQFFAMIFDKKKAKIISLSLTAFLWSFIGCMFLISCFNSGIVNTGVVYIVDALFALWLAYDIGGQ